MIRRSKSIYYSTYPSLNFAKYPNSKHFMPILKCSHIRNLCHNDINLCHDDSKLGNDPQYQIHLPFYLTKHHKPFHTHFKMFIQYIVYSKLMS